METGAFVVNLVQERLVQAMNLTSADARGGGMTWPWPGWQRCPATTLPPRIAVSPVAFECRSLSSVATGPCQTVVIGRVLAVHSDDRYQKNADQAHIDTDALDLVARSFGSELIGSHDRFELLNPTWVGLQASRKA